MTTSPTDTPKRLSDVELADMRLIVAKRPLLTNAPTLRTIAEKLLSHIAALTTPPSQGKVERAREAASSFYEHIKHGDEKHRAWLKEECDGKLFDLITQALTEPSGQGTDGADAEFMRIAVTDAMTRARQQNWKNGGVHLYDVDELIESLLRDIDRIRSDALPLPVSADGRDAVIEAVKASHNALMDYEWYAGNPDNPVRICNEDVLKSKQPSDTGAGK